MIWLLVLGCTISSILGLPLSRWQRVFWISVVVCVPGLGLLIYLPFSFRSESHPWMAQILPHASGQKEK